MGERFYRPLIFKLQVAGLVAAPVYFLLFFVTPHLFIFAAPLYLKGVNPYAVVLFFPDHPNRQGHIPCLDGPVDVNHELVVAVGQQQYEVVLSGNVRIRRTFGASRFVVDAVDPLNDTLKRAILGGQSRGGSQHCGG